MTQIAFLLVFNSGNFFFITLWVTPQKKKDESAATFPKLREAINKLSKIIKTSNVGVSFESWDVCLGIPS